MQEEMLYVVDENDNVVRETTRKEVRQKALLHRDVTVIITNGQNRLLVQKRSDKKDIYPGFWDLGMSEAVKAGDSYSKAAVSGLYEELGIRRVSEKDLEKSFLFKFKFDSHTDNRICVVYNLVHDGKIKLIDGEVTEFKFMTKEGTKELISKEKFHPIRKIIFEKYLELKVK